VLQTGNCRLEVKARNHRSSPHVESSCSEAGASERTE
jgi:hypothetical protein